MQVLLISLLASSCFLLEPVHADPDDTSTNDQLLLSTSEIIRLRGFHAEDYYVTVRGGYKLNLVKATNPLKNYETGPQEEPVLCIHGVISNANSFVLNSVNVRPRDYGNVNVSAMSTEELSRLLEGDPAGNSLLSILQLTNRQLWLLNRRGTIQSLETADGQGAYKKSLLSPLNPLVARDGPVTSLTNALLGRNGLLAPVTGLLGSRSPISPITSLLADNVPLLRLLNNVDPGELLEVLLQLSNLDRTINPAYWNYSMVEQSSSDVIEVVDFILQHTGSPKLSAIAFSIGGSLFLQSLIFGGREFESKLNKVQLWAPAFYLGDIKKNNPILFTFVKLLEPILVAYTGTLLPPLITRILQLLLNVVCQTRLQQRILCESVFSDFVFGPGGGQTIITGGYFNALFDSASTHELAHLAQTVINNQTFQFDFRSPRRNMLAYSQPSPPLMDPSSITLDGLSFWAGITDNLCSPDNVFQIADSIPVRTERFLVGHKFFNHFSFFFLEPHLKELLIVPSLKNLLSKV